MHWKLKARIMKVCANLPAGANLYKWLQTNFGNLNADPSSRLPVQLEMAAWLNEQGMSIAGKSFFEVGTGHKPVLPIGFFLMGAERVTTVDINRRLDWHLLKGVLNWLCDHRSEIEPTYLPYVDSEVLGKRFDVLLRHKNDPQAFLQAANIHYHAPMDAADTKFPAKSIDCHFSATVLEHISEPVLSDIFAEAHRLLRDDGLALHLIDLSDHFQHQDSQITRINFLQYSRKEWAALAGNEFAYTNRMRVGSYIPLFRQTGFDIVRDERVIDDESIAILDAGFALDSQFAACDATEVGTTAVQLLMRKSG